jgi:ethanolamine utilization protein EutN
MYLADVMGTVVMTAKHPAYEGQRLLWVQPLDKDFKPQGDRIIAVDKSQAGQGDRVLLMREGSGIRQILGREKGMPVAQAVKEAVPIRSLIVGIVDAVEQGS